ncbi:aureocin A53 family class IId bacteriocin [Bacillus altitudinis]|uniref:Aureocin A53 family class IId bacteriocin n=1 Tax=Bacillus altitudinis TaxID=293387 RepID=A0ABV1S8Q7_BACAB
MVLKQLNGLGLTNQLLSTVINWIKNGATFQWFSDKIDSIING